MKPLNQTELIELAKQAGFDYEAADENDGLADNLIGGISELEALVQLIAQRSEPPADTTYNKYANGTRKCTKTKVIDKEAVYKNLPTDLHLILNEAQCAIEDGEDVEQVLLELMLELNEFTSPPTEQSIRNKALEDAAVALEAWEDIYGRQAAKTVRALKEQP